MAIPVSARLGRTVSAATKSFLSVSRIMGAVRAANGSQRFVHILLVEDDAQLGAAIQRALKRLNYTVSWLTDGRSALNAIRDRSAEHLPEEAMQNLPPRQMPIDNGTSNPFGKPPPMN